MNRNTNLTVHATIDIDGEAHPVSYTGPLAEVLGLGKDDEIPEVGSSKWISGMAHWRDPEAWAITIEKVGAEWANPAHDPDTIPFPGIEPPEPTVRWSA